MSEITMEGGVRRRFATPDYALITLSLVAVLFAVLAYQTSSTVLVGAYSLGLLLCLILGGLHVGAAMGLAGGYAIWVMSGLSGLLNSLRQLPYDTVASWSISVLPMFILMGFLLWRSQVTTRLYDGAGVWLNKLPGGLAVTTKVTGAALGAASGSSVAIGYALARIAYPEMVKAGYPKRLAITSILMAGSGGQLIPPSIVLVIYAGVAGTSVGKQLLAGLLPGIVLVLFYIAFIVGYSVIRRDQFTGEVRSEVTWSDRLASFKDIWPVPLVILIVVGGMYGGFFTATEAGAAGAFIALLLLVFYQRKRSWPAIRTATWETVASAGSIFLLLIGAAVLARALSITGLTRSLTETIVGLELGRVEFLLMMILFYIVLGMFLDPIAMILLTVPLLMPILTALGIDYIWFGVFVVLMGELAIVTPPVGVLLFIIYRIVQDPEANLGQKVALRDVMISAGYFIPITILVAIVLILWPELATLIPEMSAVE